MAFVRAPLDAALLDALRNSAAPERLQLDSNYGALSDEQWSQFVAAVAGCRNIVALKLAGMMLGNARIKQLLEALVQRDSPIKVLDISSNKLTVPGARAIGDYLAATKALLMLRVEGNRFGITGAMAIADGMRANKSLINMFVGESNLGTRGVRILHKGYEGHPTLRSFHMVNQRVGRASDDDETDSDGEAEQAELRAIIAAGKAAAHAAEEADFLDEDDGDLLVR